MLKVDFQLRMFRMLSSKHNLQTKMYTLYNLYLRYARQRAVSVMVCVFSFLDRISPCEILLHLQIEFDVPGHASSWCTG